MRAAVASAAYALLVGAYSGWLFDYADATTPGWLNGLLVASIIVLWVLVPVVAFVYLLAVL